MKRQIFFALCLAVWCTAAFSQGNQRYKELNWRVFHWVNFSKYVDINSAEWKNMPLQDKKALMQIPDDELKAMSTRELIDAYVECAFTRNLFLYSEIDVYYDQLYRGFNGVGELMQRKDVVDEVVKYYSAMDPQSSVISPAGIPMRFQMQFMEYLIGNPRMVEKCTIEQQRALVRELLRQSARRGAIQYADDNLESNAYALAQLLDKSTASTANELTQLEGSLWLRKTGRLPNDHLSSKVIELAERFIGR